MEKEDKKLILQLKEQMNSQNNQIEELKKEYDSGFLNKKIHNLKKTLTSREKD